MTLQALPAQGSTSWYSWAQSIHGAVAGLGQIVAAPTGTASTDTANIQAAIDAGPGLVVLGAGTYVTTGLTMRTGVTLLGQGQQATILQLANTANADVIQGANFGTLTQGGSLNGINGWAIRGLTIDGNKANNTSGYGLRVFGYLFEIDSVNIRNCAGWGLYTEWGRSLSVSPSTITPDGAMEGRYTTLRIHDCAGGGWWNRGPNDSQASNVFIHNNGNIGYLSESMDPVNVASGSNGVNVSTYTGTGTLNVNTTVGYPTSGTLSVATSGGTATITYTGKTTTTFTGATTTAGTGTLSTGGSVSSPGAYFGTGLVVNNMHIWGAHTLAMQLDNSSLVGSGIALEGATTGQLWCRTSGLQLSSVKVYSGGVAGTYGIRMGDSSGYAVGKCILTDLFLGDPDFAGSSASTYSLNMENSYGGNKITGVLSAASGAQHLIAGTIQGNDSVDLIVQGQSPNFYIGGIVSSGGSVTYSGDARSGIITVNVPAGSTIGTAPGTLVGYSLPINLMRTPRLMVMPINSAAAGLQPSGNAYANNAGSIDVRVAPTAGTTYYLNYVLVP